MCIPRSCAAFRSRSYSCLSIAYVYHFRDSYSSWRFASSASSSSSCAVEISFLEPDFDDGIEGRLGGGNGVFDAADGGADGADEGIGG